MADNHNHNGSGGSHHHHHHHRQAHHRSNASPSPGGLPPLSPSQGAPSSTSTPPPGAASSAFPPPLPPLPSAVSPDTNALLTAGRRRRSSSGAGGGDKRGSRRHSDAGGGGGSSSAAATASRRRRRRRAAALLVLLSACCSSVFAVLLLGWLASGGGARSGGASGDGSPVRRHDASWATAFWGDNPALRLLGREGGGLLSSSSSSFSLGRRASPSAAEAGGGPTPGHGGPGVHALVLYAYAGHADPEAPANLRYFLREAAAGDRRAHYLVAVELPPGHPARVAAEARRARREDEEEEARARGGGGGEGEGEEGDDGEGDDDPTAAERRWRGRRGPLAGLVVVPETTIDEGGADAENSAATNSSASSAAVSPRALGLPALPHVRRPHLPRNARYVFHAGGCYDMGMWAHLLLGGDASGRRFVPDWRRYRLFVFINASVRGPYLPSYARGRLHWTDPFASRLGGAGPAGDVRMVGPTVSCEGSPLGGNATGRDWRRLPHVQTYAWAVGRQGLSDLLRDGTVLRCHRDRWDAIYFGELGASAAVLRAGGNLAAMMARYQGVDWRAERKRQQQHEQEWEERKEGAGGARGAAADGAATTSPSPSSSLSPSRYYCNAGATPLFEWSNDGVGVDPLEVLFVKVKRGHVAEGAYGVASVSAAHRAVAYDRWQAEADADAEAAAAVVEAAVRSKRRRSSSGGGGVDAAVAAPPALSARRAESLAANAYASELARFRAPRVLEARARGGDCFDAAAYARWNPDLAPLAAAAEAAWTGGGGGNGADSAATAANKALWRHYVYFGQFEAGRRFRFTCPMDYEKLARPPGDAPARRR